VSERMYVPDVPALAGVDQRVSSCIDSGNYR